MALLTALPEATTPGQTYTLTDGRVLVTAYDRPSTDPDARLIWREEVQTIGRDQLDFVDGAVETDGRVLVLTSDNQLTTIAQGTQTGSGITEDDARSLIDASVQATDDGLVSTGTGTIGLALINRLSRGVVITSPLVTNQTVTNQQPDTSYLVYDVSHLFGQVRGSTFVTRALTNIGENFILGTNGATTPYLVHLF